MTSSQDDFDLSAAGLRADGADVRIFLEAFANKLESCLPAQTRVERDGGGLLKRGPRRLRRLRVTLGEATYEMAVEGDRPEGFRERRVGGVSIKREPLDASQWVQALADDLREESEQGAQARRALEGLLS